MYFRLSTGESPGGTAALCVVALGMLVIVLTASAVAQTPGRNVELGVVPEEVWTKEGFDPAESAGLFVGIRRFEDKIDFAEVPYAVDDAVDLAYLFTLELGLIAPSKVVLSLAGEPQKEASQLRLRELLEAGAHRGGKESTGSTRILRAVVTQAGATGPRGLFVLAMATHGFSGGSGDFLVAADSLKLLITDTGVRLRAVFDSVAGSPAPRRLVLLDACRERFARSLQTDPSAAMSRSFAAEIGAATGQVVLAGATPGGFAYDDPERENGVFTAAVIDGLHSQDAVDERGYVTASTLADFVNGRVTAWVAEHRPEHSAVSRGIERRIAGDAARLPLAVEAGRIQAPVDFERKRKEALERLLANVRRSGPIDDEMYVAVAAVLLKADFAEGTVIEELLDKIDLLDGTKASRSSFAFYFDRNRKSLGEIGDQLAGAEEGGPVSNGRLRRAAESALLLKVVGLSDNISIVEAPGSSNVLSKMEPLKPYFVLDDTGGSYRISAPQEEGGIQGFVSKQEVAIWNIREGLRFRDYTFRQSRRVLVAAWESEERIRQYAKTGDEEAYGPTFREEAQTHIGGDDITPYPLLDTKKIKDRAGKTKRIHQVLIPAIMPGRVETGLTPEEVQAVAGAVTFCVVFDATTSMGRYARDLAKTVESMLSELNVDTGLAAAGFVLFRDLKDAPRLEIAHPMPLADATEWLRRRSRHMVGGADRAEPVLDAMMLAKKSFLWNGGTAIRGARRIAIVVANGDAKPETVALASNVPKGLTAEDVAKSLLESNISVFALQAGHADDGNLISVLSKLATETGGELYRAAVRSREISKEFSQSLEKLVSQRMDEGTAAARRLGSLISPRVGGGTVIALNVLDADMRERIEDGALGLHISGGGVVITKAWVFDEPDLYREEILIEREVLEWLVRFFNDMTDSTLDATSLRSLLEALTGEDLLENVELQELLEKRLGIHFTTDLMSFDLEYLATLAPRDRYLLQERIRNAAGALAEFLDINAERFNREPRIWMPVSYLP